MDNEKEQAVENVKRKPLSDGELHEILTEIMASEEKMMVVLKELLGNE